MTRRGTLAPPYSGLPDPRRAGPMWPAARQAQKRSKKHRLLPKQKPL